MLCIQCNKELVCNKKTKRQTIYCSIRCQHDHQYEEYISTWLRGERNGLKGACQISKHVRKWLISQRGEACWQCGWNEKHPVDNKVPLEADHIDGDHTNNTPHNLRLLCPNCHALTPTYKARNKGRGRHQRRKRYANGQSY